VVVIIRVMSVGGKGDDSVVVVVTITTTVRVVSGW
jgi:hypothetical protein